MSKRRSDMTEAEYAVEIEKRRAYAARTRDRANERLRNRRRANPETRKKNIENCRKYREKNLERERARCIETARASRLRDAEGYRARKRASYREDPEPYIRRARQRETGQKLATPPWLTREHRAQIRALYAEAGRLTRETGVEHVVDHIYPLQGRTSVGLHVPWNLTVITRAQNAAKGNRQPYRVEVIRAKALQSMLFQQLTNDRE